MLFDFQIVVRLILAVISIPFLVGCATTSPSTPDGEVIGIDRPVVDQALISADRDAQPRVRIPPQYPGRCMTQSSDREVVTLEFDVTPQGQTTNIKVVRSTNNCFDSAAINAVERWKYKLEMSEDGPRWRRSVETYMTFEKLQ